ncbi:MAG: ABC transporter ATP-binding protein [Eubacteriales bacterium]|nr:ABC transporter ATP-binding protein [Eubacteriales bacterium]MDD3866675.1 ABC transporter ATP-binding protein [Eubacteriales bacterium]MDD4462208.1 ABC transporter ATP-binding protein [Eubacteriales bacterium]
MSKTDNTMTRPDQAIILRTENLGRSFRSGHELLQVLSRINIEIPGGQLTMLKGRSGSGKTTLMNLLGALDRPSEGQVFFRDLDITALSDHRRDQLRRRDMGFVFQSVALIPTMNAFENVEFALRVAKPDGLDRRQRTEQVLQLVGLERRMRHRTQELSGGEQQRVAIARAIVHQPTVIFADEPTAELDTSMGLQVVQLFRTLVEKEGQTVVMTTHDPNMMELADQVFSLDDGVVQS